MACSKCRYWKADKVLGLSVSGAQKFGECRRYPPAPKWPTTEMEDWCGEYGGAADAPRAWVKPWMSLAPDQVVKPATQLGSQPEQQAKPQLGPSEPRQ